MNDRFEFFTLSIAALVFCVATSAAHGADGGSSAGESASELVDPYEPTARWLLDRSDARQRAAGLLYLSGSVLGGGGLDADMLLNEFERSIETTTDGAALAWLANACRSADIIEFCVDAGLDDAIVRHDEANLFSRLTLVTYDRAGTRDQLIIEAGTTHVHVGELQVVWFDALGKGPGVETLRSPYERMTGAAVVSMAYAIPPYQYVRKACGSETAADSELDRACSRITDQMISDSPTLFSRTIGLSLASSRAEARDDQATAVQMEQRKTYEHARLHCQQLALTGVFEQFDESSATNFMQTFDRHGEIEAIDRLAAQHDIDCSTPDVPGAEALERYATQLEREAGQGK